MIKIIFFILIFPTFVFAETYSCKYKELNQIKYINFDRITHSHFTRCNQDECNKQKNIIIQDLEQVLSNSNRIDDDGPYSPDLSGNSFSYMSWFFLDSGGYFSVTCRKMGNEVRKKYGWTDELSISATTKEMENFLRGNPY